MAPCLDDASEFWAAIRHPGLKTFPDLVLLFMTSGTDCFPSAGPMIFDGRAATAATMIKVFGAGWTDGVVIAQWADIGHAAVAASLFEPRIYGDQARDKVCAGQGQNRCVNDLEIGFIDMDQYTGSAVFRLPHEPIQVPYDVRVQQSLIAFHIPRVRERHQPRR